MVASDACHGHHRGTGHDEPVRVVVTFGTRNRYRIVCIWHYSVSKGGFVKLQGQTRWPVRFKKLVTGKRESSVRHQGPGRGHPSSEAQPGGRTYLDASYVAKSIVDGLDFRFSAMNLLDDTEPVGMVINNGAFHPRGRSIGVQLSARF